MTVIHLPYLNTERKKCEYIFFAATKFLEKNMTLAAVRSLENSKRTWIFRAKRIKNDSYFWNFLNIQRKYFYVVVNRDER